jgi:hypoxanthine phosphoribosyltransferase
MTQLQLPIVFQVVPIDILLDKLVLVTRDFPQSQVTLSHALAELQHLREQCSQLQACNTRLLERARKAEAQHTEAIY